MGKIALKSKWLFNYAHLYDENNNDTKIKLKKQKGFVNVDFDDSKFIGLKFTSFRNKKSTSYIYPGSLDLSFTDDNNKNTKIIHEIEGKVINHELTDKKNLSYIEDRKKKIYVYLPSTYTKEKPCEVLLCFDGHNDYNQDVEYTSKHDPYGSIQMDTIIDTYCKKEDRNIILVGIDNSSDLRESELTMDNKKYGKYNHKMTERLVFKTSGKLDSLDRFINETLLPFIKAEYNADLNKVSIYGSSCGGIAAFYLGMKNLGKYKSILAFSPAFAIYNFEAHIRFLSKIDFTRNDLPKIFIYNGYGDDLERLLMEDAKRMETFLLTRGYPKKLISSLYVESFPHNEISWRLVMPKAICYAFDKDCK